MMIKRILLLVSLISMGQLYSAVEKDLLCEVKNQTLEMLKAQKELAEVEDFCRHGVVQEQEIARNTLSAGERKRKIETVQNQRVDAWRANMPSSPAVTSVALEPQPIPASMENLQLSIDKVIAFVEHSRWRANLDKCYFSLYERGEKPKGFGTLPNFDLVVAGVTNAPNRCVLKSADEWGVTFRCRADFQPTSMPDGFESGVELLISGLNSQGSFISPFCESSSPFQDTLIAPMLDCLRAWDKAGDSMPAVEFVAVAVDVRHKYTCAHAENRTLKISRYSHKERL